MTNFLKIQFFEKYNETIFHALSRQKIQKENIWTCAFMFHASFY